jgi:hypothetical protein
LPDLVCILLTKERQMLRFWMHMYLASK